MQRVCNMTLREIRRSSRRTASRWDLEFRLWDFLNGSLLPRSLESPVFNDDIGGAGHPFCVLALPPKKWTLFGGKGSVRFLYVFRGVSSIRVSSSAFVAFWSLPFCSLSWQLV